MTSSRSHASRGPKLRLPWLAGSVSRVVVLSISVVLLPVVLVPVGIQAPLALVVFAAALGMVAVAYRFGALPTITSLALVLLGFSGTISRYAPAAGALTQVGVLLLVALGVIGVFRVRLPTLLVLAGSAYLLFASTAALVSVDRSLEYAFRGWIGLVAPVFAGLAVASAAKPSREGSRAGSRLLLWTVLFVGIVNALFGLRQALSGLSSVEIAQAVAAESTYEVGDQVRLMGVFPTNQDFGLFAACLAPALLALAIGARGAARIWLSAFTAATYLVIVLSLTRGALIAAIAMGVVVLFIWAPGKVVGRVARAVSVLAIIGVAGFLLLTQVPNARLQDSLTRALTIFDLSGDTSFLARSNRTLPRAFEALYSNLWGSGAGAAGPVSKSFMNDAPFGSLTTDNGYLFIAVQVGIFGFIAFVVLLVGLVVWLGTSDQPLARGGAAAIGALMLAMFFAMLWGLLAPIALSAAVVGLGIAAREASIQVDSKQLAPRPPYGASRAPLTHRGRPPAKQASGSSTIT